ncbi:MAG: sodium-dependent dicarboxylate transporter 2/3/5 [Moritella dasanensis]|jgi:sodium-dependent dicarboxylate transporter 2/3/5
MRNHEKGPLPTHTTEWLVNKNNIIVISGIILFTILYHYLPFGKDIVLGLSILCFVAVLWLTEALHISISAIMVPVLAVGFGVFNTQTALSPFSNPIIFLFLGGFALAAYNGGVIVCVT